MIGQPFRAWTGVRTDQSIAKIVGMELPTMIVVHHTEVDARFDRTRDAREQREEALDVARYHLAQWRG
jgi:hypothetical protein